MQAAMKLTDNKVVKLHAVRDDRKEKSLNVDKESRVAESQYNQVPDHAWTVVRTILAALTVAVLTWAGVNIDKAGKQVEVIDAHISTIRTQQDKILVQQRATHDSVLVMAATYATKEDLQKQREIFMEHIRDIEKRMRVLERDHGKD